MAPKNILMIGPTGVGKTEIARRLAKLTGAPFIKVEATKYTEVGYYGRDVESMVRELVENAIGAGARDRTRRRSSRSPPPGRGAAARSAGSRRRSATTTSRRQPDSPERHERTREKMRDMLAAGELDDRKVETDARADEPCPMMLDRHGHGADGYRPAGDVRKDPARSTVARAS